MAAYKEKVVTGLKLCIRPGAENCRKCPYRMADSKTASWCVKKLMKEALEVLEHEQMQSLRGGDMVDQDGERERHAGE